MKKEVYSFNLKSEKKGLEVGSKIYAPNGREGTVLKIISVKHITESVIEIKGEAELFPVS